VVINAGSTVLVRLSNVHHSLSHPSLPASCFLVTFRQNHHKQIQDILLHSLAGAATTGQVLCVRMPFGTP
jgi:hypothetical protein